jgi:hypothetical protein
MNTVGCMVPVIIFYEGCSGRDVGFHTVIMHPRELRAEDDFEREIP